MIEVNHITKRFGKVTAVDDFTLDTNRGSVLGIVGSNGGGKSTLLRAVKLKLTVRTFITIRLLKANVFLFPIFRIFQTAQHSKTRHIFTAVFTRIGTRTLSDNFAPCFLLTLMQK